MGTVEPLLRLDAAREAQIRDYVAGRMQPADVEAFEIAMLEDPELALAVSSEQDLRAGMAANPRQQNPKSEAQSTSVKNDFPRVRSRNWMRTLVASLSALSVGLYVGQRLGSAENIDQILGQAEVHALDVMRGTESADVLIIRVPQGQDWLVVMLPSPSNEPDSVALQLVKNGQVIHAATVRRQPFGGELWAIPTKLLQIGEYAVLIGNQEERVEVKFEVR